MAGQKGRSGGVRHFKPPELHVVDGTYHAKRHRDRLDNHVKRAKRLPRPTEELTERAQKFYRKVGLRAQSMGTLTDVDDIALTFVALAYEEYKEALDEAAGRTSTMSRRDPTVRAESAWRRVLQGLSAFGLHAQGRTQIKVQPRGEAPRDALSKWTDVEE